MLYKNNYIYNPNFPLIFLFNSNNSFIIIYLPLLQPCYRLCKVKVNDTKSLNCVLYIATALKNAENRPTSV